jgi:hypothetical protein
MTWSGISRMVPACVPWRACKSRRWHWRRLWIGPGRIPRGVSGRQVLGPRFKIETRYPLEGILYVISVNGRRLGETRSLADAKQIAQAHWESL